jgi:hypothetical protein
LTYIKSAPLLACFAGISLGACGAAGANSAHEPTHATAGAAFAWLRPSGAPAGWKTAERPNGIRLAYPPSWRRIRADPGAVSAGQVDPRSGLITGLLNATPKQGQETLQNWGRFRPAHIAEEGSTHVQVLGTGQHLTFRSGTGSCVIDRYQTTHARYQEIACLVAAGNAAAVIVAAELAADWQRDARALERSVDAFVP